MHLLGFCFAAALLCLPVTFAHAAGFRFVEIPANAGGPALKGAVWYPCAASPGEIKLTNMLSIPGVMDCPVDGNRLPLIVISTGGNGWFANQYDTAEALADAGFVTTAISHPGFTSPATMLLKQNVSDLIERPTDIKRLVDYMLEEWPDAQRIDADHIGFFGFSRGGYTGLIAVGGKPDFRRGVALQICPPDIKNICDKVWMTAASNPPHDPRIKAAVLADPAFAVLFGPDALEAATVPIQLWASARGGEMVTPESVATVASQLPSRPDYRVVPNSIHYAFLPPCTSQQQRGQRPQCADAPGFDRVAFHKAFNADVLAFFRQHLLDAR